MFIVVIEGTTGASSAPRQLRERLGGGAQPQPSEESRRSRDLACYDPLTGVLNRLGGEWLLADIGELPFAFIYVDVDHFKQINETHGHPVGDEVLKHLVSEIQLNSDALCHLVCWGARNSCCSASITNCWEPVHWQSGCVPDPTGPPPCR